MGIAPGARTSFQWFGLVGGSSNPATLPSTQSGRGLPYSDQRMRPITPERHAEQQTADCNSTGAIRPSFDVWRPLAHHHMLFAAYFARQSGLLEQAQRSRDANKCRGYVIASIMLASASLEAAINKVYCAAVDGPSSIFRNLSPWVPKVLAQFWLESHRAPTLKKYQLALILAQRTPFDKGQSPYQAAADTAVLRNALVHFRPK